VKVHFSGDLLTLQEENAKSRSNNTLFRGASLRGQESKRPKMFYSEKVIFRLWVPVTYVDCRCVYRDVINVLLSCWLALFSGTRTIFRQQGT